MYGENIRTAWLTGAGKGIGRALALKLSEEGWQVAVSSRTIEDLNSLKAEDVTGKIHAFPMDATDPCVTRTTIKLVEDQFGPLDLVILNAGTHTSMTAESFSTDTIRHLFEVNFMGVVYGLSEVIPRFMERKRGHIVVVASLAGYRGLPTAAAYGPTKAALINICESLYLELKSHGVKLSLVNPGFVKTPLTDKNNFKMPFLISATAAAHHIFNGMKKDDFEITFPKSFSIIMKILRILPISLFFFFARRMK